MDIFFCHFCISPWKQRVLPCGIISTFLYKIYRVSALAVFCNGGLLFQLWFCTLAGDGLNEGDDDYDDYDYNDDGDDDNDDHHHDDNDDDDDDDEDKDEDIHLLVDLLSLLSGRFPPFTARRARRRPPTSSDHDHHDYHHDDDDDFFIL